VRVWAGLAEGLGIRATARGCEVGPHTGLQWWGAAAAQRRAFAASCLCALHLEQLQLAAWYAVWRDRHAGARSDAEAIQRRERSPSWVWTALAPRSQLLVVVDVGSRTRALAQRVGPQVTEGVAPGCAPRWLTDGRKDSATARLPPCGHWRQPQRRQDNGPRPKPRWRPRPALLYAHVVQSYRRRRRVGGTHRVGCGPQWAIAQVWAACGWTMHTALVERLNLASRQRVAASGRRGNTLCQGEAGVRDQLAVFQVYHHVVLPHASLRQPLPAPEVTHGRGAAKVWRPWTPAMAADLPEHVWSLQEVLLSRVPPGPQPQTV